MKLSRERAESRKAPEALPKRAWGKVTVLVLGVLIVVKAHVERMLLPEGFYLRVL